MPGDCTNCMISASQPTTDPNASPTEVHDDEEHVYTHWVSRAAFSLIIIGQVVTQWHWLSLFITAGFGWPCR